MIQRKQSIWFFLAFVLLVLSYFVPVGSQHFETTHFDISTLRITSQNAGIETVFLEFKVIGLGFLAIGLLMLFNIFVYTNRILQKMLARFGVVFTLIVYFGLVYECSQLPGGINHFRVDVGTFIPLLAVFFIILGIRGINSDIKLLKSADRLR